MVEGPDGSRLAIVKTDQYIPQDLLYRRAAQLLEAEGDCGITRETLTMAATHNHSSPMYSSTSWGVWAFQDVFDIRFYNYLARRIVDGRRAGLRRPACRSGSAPRSAASTRPTATRSARRSPTTAPRPATRTPTPTTT